MILSGTQGSPENPEFSGKALFLVLAHWPQQLVRHVNHICPLHENLKKIYSSDLQIVKQFEIISKENTELISVSGVLLQPSCTEFPPAAQASPPHSAAPQRSQDSTPSFGNPSEQRCQCTQRITF